METIFMKTENSKINEPHRFRLLLADKLNLKDPNKNMALVNLMINLICLIAHILFERYKIILNTSLKKHKTIVNNPPVQMYVNRIKNEIRIEIMATN